MGHIHVQAGNMYKEAGQLHLAEVHYLAAERLIPADADLHLQLGHLYKVARRIPEAVASYQLAAALQPEWVMPGAELADLGAVPPSAPAHVLLKARAARHLGVGRGPSATFRRWRDGKAITDLRRRANAARDTRNYAAAAAFYEEVLTRQPATSAIHVQCGHMYKEAGNLVAAEQHYMTARALTPDDADLHLQIGHFHKVGGRLAEAAMDYSMAAWLAPGLDDAGDELARLRPGNAPLLPSPVQPSSLRRRPGAVPPQPSILFDEAYYRVMADLPKDVDAWKHYVQVGSFRGLDPHWLFSTGFYLESNPDVARAGEVPLLHYLRSGGRKGRAPHPLFSPRTYLRLHPEVASGDALDHLLNHGLQENRQPHPLFVPTYYLSLYPGLAASGMSAFEHFVRHGDGEGKVPHPLFDPEHYLGQQKLPQATPRLQHYIRYGRHNSPHHLFDGSFYLRTNPDVAASGASPLVHYIQQGGMERRDPHPLFDTDYYLEQAGEAAFQNPLLHYVMDGASRSLSPNRLFEPTYYRGHMKRSWDGRPLPQSGPRLSILVPVYNTPPAALRECIESVRRQSYGTWELCLIDDCSTDAATLSVLDGYRGVDERIKVSRAPTNLHISGATNLVAQQATGEFIAFLDHDDALAPQALAEVALAVQTRPDTDLLYTDEDKIDVQGRHVEQYRKPDWSPDHLNSVMYVLHFLVIRKALFWRLGGLRPERSGAQDYDLALRASQRARHVHHIPSILYHWRMIPGSAAAEVGAKPYALQAARSALEDALAASGADAKVEDGLLQGTFRVRYSLKVKPAVTLLVFTNDSSRNVAERGTINLVRNFVRSIAEKSTYSNYRLLVVDNGNSSPETSSLIKEVGGDLLSFTEQGPFNYARKANFATSAVLTNNLVYLNDDLEVISPEWIEALLELSSQHDVGGVGAKLFYPDNTVQHAGVVIGVGDSVAHAFLNTPRNQVGYNGYTHIIRNYSAVTGAVFATRKDIMDAVGGMDEQLRIDFNDVDLCLRIGQYGRRIAFTPYCELYHFERSTQIRITQAQDEAALFKRRWAKVLDYDPCYNPGSPRDRFDFV